MPKLLLRLEGALRKENFSGAGISLSTGISGAFLAASDVEPWAIHSNRKQQFQAHPKAIRCGPYISL